MLDSIYHDTKINNLVKSHFRHENGMILGFCMWRYGYHYINLLNM